MGFDEGQIILDSDNGAYYPGQNIYGRIVFDQNKVKTIHGIYVDVKGFCKVHWSREHSRTVNDRTEHYTVNHDSHEEYFRTKTYVFGTANGEHHLQPGHHEFRFECHIPANSPSSFEGSHGHIRYRVKAVMVTSGMFSMNKDKMLPIRVIAPTDLNTNPYCKEPIEYELLSSYCCWCVSAGSSEILVKLPVGGYCPGQTIPVEVTCKNPSSVEIDEIKFAVKKVIVFTAESEPAKQAESETVMEVKKGPIPPSTTRNWTVEMQVPVMDVYNLNACRFIDIDYQFKVSTEVSGCHEGSEETHPIVFGTIPLVGFQDNIQNPLQDQLPKITGVQHVQTANSYPPPPIINQPLPNSPYANGNVPYPNTSPYPGNGNVPYPNTSPYPGNPGYPTTPNLGRNSPYPPENQPYPNVSPYPGNLQPGANSSFPGANPPYPAGSSPYPQNNAPYPPGSLPFPTNTPYSTDNPGTVPPYPPGSSPLPGHRDNLLRGENPSPVPQFPDGRQSPMPPYAGGRQSPMPPYAGGRQSPMPPYPGVTNTTLLKTGTFGFTTSGGDPATVPLLPPGANVPPYPTSPPSNPYATASAPEPSTPGSDEKKLPHDISRNAGSPESNSDNPAYNPEFMNSDKKEKKDEN